MLFYPTNASGRLRIGVFDSGVGGLSVLRALGEHLPDADLHYVADSAHAPYGERDDAHVAARTTHIAGRLVEAGAQMLVIACNTATAVAAHTLRDAMPGLPIIGVEPGLKPAVSQSRRGRIGVMATGTTLRSDKFRHLLAANTGTCSVHLQACDGLAAAIEAGELNDPSLIRRVAFHCKPLRDAQVDVVVLGCTHYPFVSKHIQRAMGDNVVLVDTSQAVARHAATTAALVGVGPSLSAQRTIQLQTTGDVARLRKIAENWLRFTGSVSALAARPLA